MDKSNVLLYLGIGALVASAAALATVGPDALDESVRDGIDPAEALAAAYWSDRTGQLPPNRPITKRPTPDKSRHMPPNLHERDRLSPAAPSLPAGRRQ